MAQTAAQEQEAPAEELIPSTSPLDRSLDKLMGAKKKTSLVGYAPSEFANVNDFRPGTDTINVSGNPATGATMAESWSHDIALENLRRQALETEYTQRTAAQEFAYKQQQAELENARQAAQLGISKSAEARAGQQFGLQRAETEQSMALKQAAENRQKMEDISKYYGLSTPQQVQGVFDRNNAYNLWLQGRAGNAAGMTDQFNRYLVSGGTQNTVPITQKSSQQLDLSGNPVNHGLAYGETYYGGGPTYGGATMTPYQLYTR